MSPQTTADSYSACDECAGTGWAPVPDAAHDGDLIDTACPCAGTS